MANGPGAILFGARSKIAASETAKYGHAPAVRAFALQTAEDFLYSIFGHSPVPMAAVPVCRRRLYR
jgi:hypothetical protein